jgi:polysaccharide chain length determinant protein (PEP-CTERM system associated)
MVRNGEISMTEVKRVFRKHWWITVSLTILATALAFIATLVLPKKYTSTTSVLVEQPVVPTDYVKPVVTLDLNQRLASMKAQLLSTSRLQPILYKFNLYPDRRGKVPDEQLVSDLQKSIEVELLQPMQGSMNRQPPGFKVGVTFDNPKTAQQICEEITDLFMSQNKIRRIEQATDTTEFLSGQLDEAKQKMDEQDGRLADFKRKYLGELPEETQTNLSLLTGLNTQLEALTQNLNRAQQDKGYNETMLTQQEATWKLFKDGNGTNPDTEDQQLARMQDQLTDLLSRYTPEYPDVVKLKSQIADLKARIAAEPDTPPVVATSRKPGREPREPVQIQQLRAKIRQDEQNIAELGRSQNKVQDQIRVVEGRVQASPMVEEQFKELTRNSKAATDFYDELLKKRSNSAMATDLEHQQQSETFSLLDPPSFPSSPSFPKLPVFLGGGFVAGLVMSLALLYVLAMLDKSLYSERDVEKALKLPVLASVPSLDAEAAHKIQKGRKKPGNFDTALPLKA